LEEIYLDNSATTKVYPEAAEKAFQMMTRYYGNPSSLHSMGLEAEHQLTAARKIIASSMNALPEEIYFTSGGTEGNNTAVFGAVNALKKRGNRIVTTAIEHSSVMEAMQKLEKDGFEVIYLSPDINGKIRIDDVRSAVTKDTILVSIMAVNNELGSIQPIEKVHRIIENAKSPALFHVDAVQAFMKMPLVPKKYGIDLMTVSGHKIHAPKGVGALYIRKGVRILPLHSGGLQEKGIRPGTEPVPAACAMGVAVDMLSADHERHDIILSLNSYCREKLSEISEVVFNSDNDALPYIINISIPGFRSETLLHYLAEKNIFVSSGSACAKGHKSHVLASVGLDGDRIDSALRISFSEDITKENIDYLILCLKNAVSSLARSK